MPARAAGGEPATGSGVGPGGGRRNRRASTRVIRMEDTKTQNGERRTLRFALANAKRKHAPLINSEDQAPFYPVGASRLARALFQ